jgi:outer membrane protein TolC
MQNIYRAAKAVALNKGLLALTLALAVSLTGCASLRTQPPDSSINALLQNRGGPSVEWSQVQNPSTDKAPMDEWLAAPLSPDSAVRIAMLRSPKLQQEYARLGLARADVLEAVQISNPSISLRRQNISPGDGVNRTLGFAMPLVDLILLPSRTRLAHADFERARFDTAKAVFDVALDVESAWYAYVGAQQVADMRTAVANATQVSADLAERFYAAGNITELQLNQERAAASEARIEAGAAKVEAEKSRLALNNLMGLDSNQSPWTALDRLPLPVAQEDELSTLIGMAREKNLQLLAARQQVLVMQVSHKSTKHWRWLGGTGMGYEREKEADGTRLSGPSLDLELPIFNQGQAKLARSQALLAEANSRLREAELSIENTIRADANAVRAHSEAVGIFRNALIPQREKVLARSQQEQNFMLIGVFELIQAKAKEYDAYQGYLEAVRDYWQARVELTRTVGERLPSDARPKESTPSVKDILTPQGGMQGMDHSKMKGMDHSGHDMSTMKPTEESEAMEGMDHSGHDMSTMQETDENKDMQGMDHSGHDMSTMQEAESTDASSEEGGDPRAEASEKAAAEIDATDEKEKQDDTKTDEHQHKGAQP